MKPSELTEHLTFSMKNNFPVMITGPSGIGKSDILEQAASQANAKLIITHPAVSDPTDYKGLPFPNKNGSADFLPFGDLKEILDAKEKTVYFLDDLGQASNSVQAACMQLILARRINGHKVSDKVIFMAATNRRRDNAGVTNILEPLKSRMVSIIELIVDVEEWITWAICNNMPVELMGFIRYRPDMLLVEIPSKEIVNNPSPRTIYHAGQQQNAGLNPKLEFEAIKGSVGEAFAIEYMGYLKMFRELPPIDDILGKPDTAKISNEPSTQYAISCVLAKKMNNQNIGSICKYLDRMPEEVSVACMRDAASRDEKICSSSSFIKWSSKKAHLFI